MFCCGENDYYFRSRLSDETVFTLHLSIRVYRYDNFHLSFVAGANNICDVYAMFPLHVISSRSARPDRLTDRAGQRLQHIALSISVCALVLMCMQVCVLA